DGTGLGDPGLGGGGNLVVEGFFERGGGAVHAARGRAGLFAGTGQLIGDGDLAGIGGAVGFIAGFDGLRRAHDLAFGIEDFRGAGRAVEVEFGGDLNAGAAKADDGGEQFLDTGAQAVFDAQRALFHGLGGDRDVIVARTRGEQGAGAVDDGDGVGRQS